MTGACVLVCFFSTPSCFKKMPKLFGITTGRMWGRATLTRHAPRRAALARHVPQHAHKHTTQNTHTIYGNN